MTVPVSGSARWLLCAFLAWGTGTAVARGDEAGAAAQEVPADEVARGYYEALLAADTAAARARSNGLLPVAFGKLDSVQVGDPEPVDPCPDLPEIPASLREGAGTEEQRRYFDSIAAAMDSLLGPMRGAERCVEVATTLIVAETPSSKRVTVAYPTLLRLLPEGWRVDAFVTGQEVAPALLGTMGSLLRDLGEALPSQQEGGS